MNQYFVIRPGQTAALVTADYFKVENGVLVFRNAAKLLPNGQLDYPQPVHVFAAGAWLEVTQ